MNSVGKKRDRNENLQIVSWSSSYRISCFSEMLNNAYHIASTSSIFCAMVKKNSAGDRYFIHKSLYANNINSNKWNSVTPGFHNHFKNFDNLYQNIDQQKQWQKGRNKHECEILQRPERSKLWQTDRIPLWEYNIWFQVNNVVTLDE